MNRFATLSNSLMLMLLLGASDTLTGALGMLVMFAIVNGLYGLCRLPLRLREMTSTLASVLIAATLTSCAEIAAQRLSLPWYQHSSLYAGLIALQCVVLEHNGFYRQPWIERLKLCGLFAALMVVLALLREWLGHGAQWATQMSGAFILLGLLLAIWQAFTRKSLHPEETHRP
ncbi:NADH:quinone oxidoreductase [Pseudomonas syringae]|nr:NADH:quinone oxidoreductase [Pseudomonas syringae]MCF5069596.1 NADH:quinone oxidoreductase [Pseudomonas syringae]